MSKKTFSVADRSLECHERLKEAAEKNKFPEKKGTKTTHSPNIFSKKKTKKFTLKLFEVEGLKSQTQYKKNASRTKRYV